MEPYHYNQMNKAQQAVYLAMKTGLTALDASFIIPRMDMRELTDLFFRLRLDYPDIFYACGFSCRSFQGSDNLQMIPDYLFDKNKVKEHQKAMKSRVEKLVRPALALSEWEKERYVHDFICSNVRYDKLKKQYSHEIIGPLGQGVGVCEGIAKTVKILCDALGIWCIIPISDANPDKKIKYRHAWNLVRIGGTYYHLDATFDNSLGHGDIIRYDYFNLEDRQLFRDHEPVLYQVPSCSDGNHFYYREKKLSFTKVEEVVKRAAQAMKKGKPLVFHWRGGYLTRDVVSELYVSMEEAAKEKGTHARISLNWQQAVFWVTFVEAQMDVTESAVVVEEANEGEIKETGETS